MFSSSRKTFNFLVRLDMVLTFDHFAAPVKLGLGNNAANGGSTLPFQEFRAWDLCLFMLFSIHFIVLILHLHPFLLVVSLNS